MALRIKISARAASQLRKAAEWWAQNRPAAPGAVGADFREAVVLLAEQPGIGAWYEGARAPGVRRLYLGRSLPPRHGCWSSAGEGAHAAAKLFTRVISLKGGCYASLVHSVEAWFHPLGRSAHRSCLG